jgi:hypothetical protein
MASKKIVISLMAVKTAAATLKAEKTGLGTS